LRKLGGGKTNRIIKDKVKKRRLSEKKEKRKMNE
jgi:hypothetical protein